MATVTRAVFISGFIFVSILGCEARELLMVPIPDDTGVSPKILNGRRADRSEWPVTLQFNSNDGGRCTGTIVGERVVVTAAHCVNDAVNAQVLLSNQLIDLSCQIHPQYDDNPNNGGLACHQRIDASDIVPCTADIALCVTNPGKVFPATAGKFERVKGAPPGAAARQRIALLGYGCTVPNGAVSTELNVGNATVRRTSQPGSSSNPQNAYNEFIETDGAAVCYGDSGGAAYSSTNPSSREILGISSRGNISSISYLVNVTDPRIAKFFQEFSKKYDARICGIHAAAANCIF